ncbi:hypothetical protein FIBSPDRAFT_881408 [Athelia psychrophila]|uniref:Uncharacterized protein n=1 Tax=Athelia psychrophila TaxID=1759441 RepID=A0A166WMX9_9AGAM|nr:hypothetical protein FIBSPDRAFT_881408 [Fibularhizoctonia sp. CBS 109695]
MASGVEVNRLWLFFHNSGVKQNASHWKVHCRGCVAYHEEILEDGAAADGLLLQQRPSRIQNIKLSSLRVRNALIENQGVSRLVGKHTAYLVTKRINLKNKSEKFSTPNQLLEQSAGSNDRPVCQSAGPIAPNSTNPNLCIPYHKIECGVVQAKSRALMYHMLPVSGPTEYHFWYFCFCSIQSLGPEWSDWEWIPTQVVSNGRLRLASGWVSNECPVEVASGLQGKLEVIPMWA